MIYLFRLRNEKKPRNDSMFPKAEKINYFPTDGKIPCQKYRVKELSVFGSSIRDDFKEESDVDFLVSYLEEMDNTLIDMARLNNELSELVNRKTDLVEKEALQNQKRKNNFIHSRGDLCLHNTKFQINIKKI